MRYTLKDYRTTLDDGVTIGTCTHCMSTVDVKSHLFFFEDEDGNETIIPGYSPSYDKVETIEIENIPHFASWIAIQDMPTINESDPFIWLNKAVTEYNNLVIEMKKDFYSW